MKIVSIFKTVGMITFFSILTRFLGFIFRIFLSRELGAEGIGLFQIAFSIIGVFMTFVASGLPLTTAKLVAKYEDRLELNKKHIATTTSSVIAIVISIVSCLILLLGKKLLSSIIGNTITVDLILIMSPALIFSAVYAVFRGALWGQNSFFWVSFAEFLEQAIRIVMTFLFIFVWAGKISSTHLVAYAFTLTCLISSILVIVIYFINGGRLRFRQGQYKEFIKSSAPITGIRIASSLLQPLTALLIPMLLGYIGYTNSEAVSLYGIIMGMSFPLLFAPLSIVGSLSMVLIPKISTLHSNKQYDTINSNISKSIEFSLFLAILIIPLYLSCGDLIGVVLYDNLTAGIYLQLSAVCILPIVLNNISSSILNALNLEVKSFVNYIIGAIVLLVSLVSLTFIIGEMAIVVSYFLSSMTTAILNLNKIKKAVPNFDMPVSLLLLKYALIIFPTSVLGHLISNVLYNFIPAFFAGLIGGGMSIIGTILLIKIFNVYNFNRKKLINN